VLVSQGKFLAQKGKLMSTRCDRPVSVAEIAPLDHRDVTGDA
jgi:hypothetical protein